MISDIYLTGHHFVVIFIDLWGISSATDKTVDAITPYISVRKIFLYKPN